MNSENITYFDSFRVEQKKLKDSLKAKTLQQIFIEHKHMIQ